MQISSTVSIPTTFISANSENGFFSLYDTVFHPEKMDKIFVIAGGPGTGKSTFLKELCTEVQQKGVAIEKILCSSDPQSLDGLILRHRGRSVGVFDGTPPHGRVLHRPAIIEELWNLGELWDSESISRQKEEILFYNEQKSNAYARAYALLRSLGALKEERRIFYRPYFEKEKAARQIRHKMKGCRPKGEREVRLLRAFSTAGEVTLFPIYKEDQQLLLIGGKEAAAEIYLSFFAEYLKKAEIEHTVFFSPLSPDIVDAIYINEEHTLFLKEGLNTQKHSGRRIVADRFFTAPETSERESKALAEGIKNAVHTALKEAGEAHAAIEKCYKTGMDYQALGRFKKEKKEALLSALGI